MASPNQIVYDAGRAGYAVLQHPTVTVAHATEVSNYQRFTVLVRITFTVRALITVADAFSLRTVMEHYRTVLSVSGGVFRAQYGSDANFLQADPLTDVTGGPHPISLDIQELHGGRSAIIIWTLQTQKHVKDDNVNAVGAWLDFVYTISTSINANYYVTRTISGVLRLSACHSQTMYRSADAFRETVENNIAPVPATGIWQRTAREFRLSEDQKVLAFTIVDEQLYTALPFGITQGDMALTVISEMYGTGRYILSGWFEANPSISRGNVAACVKEIWALFFNLVIQRIETETAGNAQWYITNERRSYIVHWRSNRVEFEAAYEVKGEWERGIPDNIEYTVSRALDWLAYLSRKYNRAIMNLGPNGSVPVVGPSGYESPGPVILIDPMEKLPSGFAYGPGVSRPGPRGDGSNVTAGAAAKNSYLTWHQSFEYKFDSGVVFIPVKGNDVPDVIQQAKNISLILVVSGEAERIGTQPEFTSFPFTRFKGSKAVDSITRQGDPQLVLISSDIVMHEPSVVGVYKTTWKQVYRFHNTGDSLPLKWPYTPLNEEISNKLVPTTDRPLLTTLSPGLDE